jgi:type II secretion system protein I
MLRQDGFTLLETLVAMMILSIALVIVFQLFSEALNTGHISESHTRAVWHAREKMEELLLYKTLSEEIQEGDFEDGYRWRYRIQQAASDSQLNLEGVATFTITVWVSWAQGQKTKNLDISALTIAKLPKRRKMHIRKRQSGFTLIELLLSLSILSIILVVILGALRIGVRAWEKGENVLAVQQRSRTILDQLSRQLASAAVLMSAQEEQPLVIFAGNSQTIEFTSGLPLIAKIQIGPVHAKYVIETDSGGNKRLLLYEENITVDDYLSERQLRHGTDAVVLVEALDDLRFEYLDAEGDGPNLNWTCPAP